MKKVWSMKTNELSGNALKRLLPEVMRPAHQRRAVGATFKMIARQQAELWIFGKFNLTVLITA